MTTKLIIEREELNTIILAGLKTAEFDFLDDLLETWLDKYPSDLDVLFQHALLFHRQLKDQESCEILQKIIIADPEYLPAYDLFIQLNVKADSKALNSAIHVLSGRLETIDDIYPWAVTLRAVRQSIRKREFVQGERLLRKIIVSEEQNLLAVVEHCRLSNLVDENLTLLQLTEIYHKRWPNCIQIDLFRAKALYEAGREAEAVSLLHTCVSRDPAGIVSRRLWGSQHEFLSLWPKSRSIELDMQIPASIAVALDWNQLPAGEISPYASKQAVRAEEGTRQAPEKTHHDSPSRKKGQPDAPVYVILSTRMGLEAKYGQKTADVIIQKMGELGEVLGKKPKWQAAVFLPDDFSVMEKFGLSQISAIDPWKIKLALADLDKWFRQRSKIIGALVIIGCHEVVPFHRLPNPTDDSDEFVFSDNPYATTTSNYLLPEWPVGRMPGEKGNDAGLVLEQLRHVIEFHKSAQSNQSLLGQAFSVLTGRMAPEQLFQEVFKKPHDFGYSAAVWRRASLAVFRPIGNGSDLRVSPEFEAETIDVENLLKAKCAYFNLHGLASTPDWYGQRDYSEPVKGPDFPVAISTRNIPNSRNNIDLIISEACYGGFINDKTIDDSMALKLISIGSQGLVASTCISYGSVYTPLIGADLLSFIIWKYTREGYSFGEAFLQAKIGLINVMTQRQGYLDGEDQKTLLSFVFYGDPLGCLEPNITYEKKISRDGSMRDIQTVSDQDGTLAKVPRISKERTLNLNSLLNSYLPSLDNASMKIREHRIKLNKVLQSAPGVKSGPGSPDDFTIRTQVMYSQKTSVAHTVHEQFARVTLDENGKVIKLAVSR